MAASIPSPFITFDTATNIFSITPTTGADIGVFTVTVTIHDSISYSNSSSFTVTVTNTAPYFTIASFPVFNSRFNKTSSLQITEFADDESNPITLEASLLVSGTAYPLPAFISITGNTIYSNPTLISQIGLHTLRLKISDGSGQFNTKDISLLL